MQPNQIINEKTQKMRELHQKGETVELNFVIEVYCAELMLLFKD